MAIFSAKQKTEFRKKIIADIQTEAKLEFKTLTDEAQIVRAIAAVINKLQRIDSSYRNYIMIDNERRPGTPGDTPTIAEKGLERMEIEALALDKQLTILTKKLADTQNKKHAEKVRAAEKVVKELRVFKYNKAA